MTLTYLETDLDTENVWVQDYHTGSALFLTGQVIPARTVVGMVTASKKVIPSISDASDGSQNPIGITLFDIDTSATGTNADTTYDIITEARMVDFGGLADLTDATSGTGAQKWTQVTLNNALRTYNINVKTFINN